MAELLTRAGNPVHVPFTDQSADEPFDMAGLLPRDANDEIRSDLVFSFANFTLYDVRLEGTKLEDDDFVEVQFGTGHFIMARTEKGVFTSKKPRLLSCQAFSTPGAPITADSDFTGCFLQLQYYTVSR